MYGGNAIVTIVHLDKNFSEEDKRQIVKALDQWNYVLNGYMVFRAEDTQFDMEMYKLNERDYYFLKVDSGNYIVQEADLRGREHGDFNVALGFVPQIGQHFIYLVRDRLGEDDIFYLALHEMGHALGATHNGQGLMYPRYSKINFQCVDQLTVEKVAAYQKMDIKYLNYCY